ncbi:MAG: EAL domain-containing protein, partial [Sulfurovum sp.]|nr:EAL domain-containing protein [Sulfurovum sp.]
RTSDIVQEAEATATLMRIIFILFAISLLIMIWRVRRSLYSILGTTLSELHSHILQMGSGNFTSSIPVPGEGEKSILAWLSKTQKKLLQIDIKRKKAEQNAQRISQLYATLSQCNKAIIHSNNELELFQKICKNAIYITDIKMAWIGLIDEQNKQLKPVAYYGIGTDYLKDLHITIDENSPLGNGPSGTVCREDRPFWSQNFQHDPSTDPWHERAKEFNWKSSAALPLHKKGVVIGTLNLYSSEANAFNKSTQGLLQKMTADIDHAINTYEQEKARNKAEEALTNSHNLLITIINTVPARIFWKDTNLNYLGCNYAFAKDAGEVTPQNIIGKSDYDFCWKENAKFYRADDRNIIELGASKLFYEEVQKRPDGTTVWLRTSKVPMYDKKNSAIGIVGMYEDITEHKLVEISLRESQSHLQAIIENEPECVKLVDAKGNLLEMNPAGLEMLQADTFEEVQQHTLVSYLLPEWRAPFIALHKKVMRGNSGILEFEIQGLKGKRRWLETHAVPMRDANKKVTTLLGITRDVTQRKESEKHIQYLANFDILTGLPNRVKLDEQLTYLINLAKRKQTSFALMFIDVDNFKDINDTLGHNIGDILLVELSKRLKSILRDEDTLARLGGDEFILLLPESNVDEAQKVAQKLLYAIQAPFSIEQYELNITASIGIALYPTDGLDKETLSKNADAAMYRAKEAGRNGYSFFTEEMQTISTRKLQLLNALYHALSRNEFHIVYQPQISLATGHVIGAEALLRWEHPEFGTISPVEFIPIAESSGLILSIGEWVLRSAAEQLKDWMESGMSPIIMAINLSAVQFRHPNLPDLVTQILQSTKLPSEYLELELTESVAMHNPKEAISIINNLHERGIRMSIDDFGTGYSSLSYLKKFKVYKLKIDQSFVRDISTDPEDKAIVAAIINMAHSLGLRTIAEGVETTEQLDYLSEQGCDEAQGYYYNKPLLADEFERLYKDEKYLKPNIWIHSI